MTKIRKRKCKICGEPFETYDSFRGWCSPECGVTLAKQKQAKQREKAQREKVRLENAKIRAVKERLKTHHQLIAEAQSAVNKYIRFRDANKECISCGTPLISEKLGGGFDAGHYRSRGSAPHLRFYTLNIFGQCKRCNRWLDGNYHQYRIGLIDRLGIEKVEAIESDQRPRHYSDEDLRRIKRIFERKVKLLEKRGK
ncbi:recombination protein NinG [Avibacterium paragallinarum]|uniref:recombination protein NinG n=1 Tax=Avibacterium paragallinarum TaxID=728 RepID=UPI00188EAD28|nr:recombination protein NinG [Avibacterium paragallinarum]QZP14648.1 recombination protein NinG [Avibacterium paragallinarum]WAL56315.1 recombination protein NinG [Avibacterium paragallinarum]WAM58900.1 recombination protein NinG [Avibacterium paragallinarum]